MSVIAVTWIRSQASLCEICGGQNDAGAEFSLSTSDVPCQYHSTNAVYLPSSACCSYQKDESEKPGNLPKCSFGNLGALVGKLLSLLSLKV
jgi:hypothetical protein